MMNKEQKTAATLYYYSTYDCILREAAVTKETARMYYIEPTHNSSTQVNKGYMTNGNLFFFTDKAVAIERAKDLARYKIAELDVYRQSLADLEGMG